MVVLLACRRSSGNSPNVINIYIMWVHLILCHFVVYVTDSFGGAICLCQFLNRNG